VLLRFRTGPELLRFKTGPDLLGIRTGIDEKKRSKEKSSQQKTPPRMAQRRLVLWHAPALLAKEYIKRYHNWKKHAMILLAFSPDL
tara:strand:- start:130 stop:387 length:258 start_codon:yes stop_codon:yes gene_type:complete